MTLPWDEMWDALGRYEAARRAGDEAAADAALDEVKASRERLGLLGGLLFLLMTEYAGSYVKKKLAREFNGLGLAAYRKSQAAAESAEWAAQEVADLRHRVRELEEKLARGADRGR